MIRKALVFVLLCLSGCLGITLFVEAATGQDFGAERPGVTDGTFIVAPGTYQFELGYTFAEYDDFKASDFPQSLARTGLIDNLELRVGWDGYTFVEDGNNIAQDMFLGLKYMFLKQEGWIPNLGVLGTIIMPTGAESEDFGGGAKLVASWEINDLTLVGANLGIATVPKLDGRVCEVSYSVIVKRELSDKFYAFGEYYATLNDDIDKHLVDVGVAYLANENFQIDLSVGAGLNDDAPDWIVSVGFAYSLR